MKRVILGQAPSVRRRVVADAPAGVAVPVQGKLFSEAGAELTEWVLGYPPPMTGWWNYRIEGTTEQGRLWYETGGLAGVWFREPGGKPIARHDDIEGTMAWQGLTEAWPEGYRYPVGGAKKYRAKLMS